MVRVFKPCEEDNFVQERAAKPLVDVNLRNSEVRLL